MELHFSIRGAYSAMEKETGDYLSISPMKLHFSLRDAIWLAILLAITMPLVSLLAMNWGVDQRCHYLEKEVERLSAELDELRSK